MNLNITLIRGGRTQSSLDGKYLGMSDEPLLDDETARLEERIRGGVYPPVSLVYASPLLRCREVAALIYPRIPAVITDGLRAFDSGRFEGKTHKELIEDEGFREWVNTHRIRECPDGESLHQLTGRSIGAFLTVANEMDSKGIEATAIITHKLVITAILQRFCIPRSTYRSWDVEWGGGYSIDFDSRRSTAKIRDVL